MYSPDEYDGLDRVAYDREFGGKRSYDVESKRIVSLLGDTNNVLMMENHGILTVADTVVKAFDYMYKVEMASRIQLTAMSSGMKLKNVSLARTEKFRFDFATAFPDSAQKHLDAINRVLESASK